jgi:hypothetical protein
MTPTLEKFMNNNELFKRQYIGFILIILAISSCSRQDPMSEQQTMFTALYPEIPFSGYLELSPIKETWHIVKGLVIKNVSDEVILLPPAGDYDLLVYDPTDNKWRRVEDKLKSINDSSMYLYPRVNLEKLQFQDWTISVDPNIADEELPVTVRLVIIGEIIENGLPTGKKAGGYYDIIYDLGQ